MSNTGFISDRSGSPIKHLIADAYRRLAVKNFAKRTYQTEEIEREKFARLLWTIFPHARSEHELADCVAELLNSVDLPTHPRTVRNWLRCDNAPAFRYVMFVISVTGPEALIDDEAA